MIKILGGYTLEKKSDCTINKRVQLPTITNPSELEVVNAVHFFSDKSGVLELKIDPEPAAGVSCITLYSENERYLTMLEEYLDDGDIKVRTFNNESAENNLAIFFGESYPAKAIVMDIKIVSKVFTEFLLTDNVSTESMK